MVLLEIEEDAKGNLRLSLDYEKQKIVTGYKRNMLERLYGSPDYYKPNAFHSDLVNRFDINQDGRGNIFTNLKKRIFKYDDPSWSMNIIESVRSF